VVRKDKKVGNRCATGINTTLLFSKLAGVCVATVCLLQRILCAKRYANLLKGAPQPHWCVGSWCDSLTCLLSELWLVYVLSHTSVVHGQNNFAVSYIVTLRHWFNNVDLYQLLQFHFDIPWRFSLLKHCFRFEFQIIFETKLNLVVMGLIETNCYFYCHKMSTSWQPLYLTRLMTC
jgi:hypothetical protein